MDFLTAAARPDDAFHSCRIGGAIPPGALNTRLLFRALLRDLDIDVICDVGAMDGAESFAFRAMLPAAKIFAFEPNPQNFDAMAADSRFREQGIELVQAAVGEQDGTAAFYLVPAGTAADDPRRGMSSLFARSYVQNQQRTDIRVVRLDRFLAERKVGDAEQIALWIDAEGYAFQVIRGVQALGSAIRIVHVELESEPCINEAQHLYSEVRDLLETMGLKQVATDRPASHPQFNAVFVRSEMSPSARRKILRRIRTARIRGAGVQLLRKWCPALARWLAAFRRRVIRNP